jgi:glycosyltransferase involved in cell wall biosynthesis
VKFHGPKAAGPELYAHYCTADVYVIASKSDFEGFPRTIWEAMAHSLPVVATNVGSIPDFVGESAELVVPANSKELAKAIRMVMKNPIRRREMIHRGRSLALDSTLETQVGNLIRDVERWVGRRA